MILMFKTWLSKLLVSAAIVSLILIVFVELGWTFIPAKHSEELNSLGVILASGYLGSYIVYFLTVELVEFRDFKRTQAARKKMFAIASSYVSMHIVAAIRGGVIKPKEEVTVENLESYLLKNPLYEKFVNAKGEESLCEHIWSLLVYFQSSIIEYATIWSRYLSNDALILLSEIKDSAFYRCMNDQFSSYNNKPITLPDGNKVFVQTVLGKILPFTEEGYNDSVRLLLQNLVALIKKLEQMDALI